MLFSDISAVLAYIEQKTNFQLGLLRVQEFLNKAHLDYHKIKFIHIGGTNGKGSTTFYLANILINSGYKTGMFSSPSLEAHNDRIRINNNFISDESIIAFVNEYYDLIEETQVTMFEIDVVMALDYFIKNDVEIAVMEVGMGGRYDGTNIINPLISVITNIGLDHQQYLGASKAEIATTKAGIIKENGLLITSENDQQCLEIIQNEANLKHAQVIEVKSAHVHSLKPIIFDYQEYYHLELASLADYQIKNVSMVLEIIKVLKVKFGFNISEEIIRCTLLNIKWPGRFEVMSYHPFIVIDGAHNVEGISELSKILDKYQEYHKTIVFAALKDKQTDDMVKLLIDTKSEVIISEFAFYRTKKAIDINKNFNLEVQENYEDYLINKIKLMNEQDMLIITGSLYFISEIRKLLLNII
ncbi:MAG: bifunctional folylpolyglutamate synthase/dihydrofolate synthase [Bacilli bacterium]|jgi:dihydrofolate synthase/folylpolyglutamate synthase|nr:bifunctional folylpolyglutamate synthase/dihydrofolate synthase [Bacilli bacterium]